LAREQVTAITTEAPARAPAPGTPHEKQARRQEAAAQKANNPTRADGVDPDLEGIQLGPQPLQDWQKTE
jgi:hypothetical protein